MIEGMSHITFVVRDLDRMAGFLTAIFDAEEVYASGETIMSLAPEKFLLINGIWIAVMEGDPPSEKTYDHIAFKVSEADLQGYSERIRTLGI